MGHPAGPAGQGVAPGGASTLEQANQVLAAYLPKFNQQFGVAPAQPAAAFHALPAGLDLEAIFSFHYRRRVANDHTISVDNHTLQLPPTVLGRSYARASVDLHHLLDGRLAVLYQGQLLVTFEPAVPGPPRVDHFCPQPGPTTPSFKAPGPEAGPPPKPARPPTKPAPDHPWRRGFAERQARRSASSASAQPPDAGSP